LMNRVHAKAQRSEEETRLNQNKLREDL
jgi:hypothetical protein